MNNLDIKTILIALATILSALANLQTREVGGQLTAFEVRTNAHSQGRRARFERIEVRLHELEGRGHAER